MNIKFITETEELFELNVTDESVDDTVEKQLIIKLKE